MTHHTLPAWITDALAADPIPATEALLDKIAGSLRCARASRDAWGHTAEVLNSMEARTELQKARAALGYGHSAARIDYGKIADAIDAAYEAEGQS